MPCGACGCACSEARRDELEAPLLMDIETGSGHITAAPPDGVVDEPADAEMDKCLMILCCIVRGLLALLYLYLLDLIRRFISGDGDDGGSGNRVFTLVFSATVVGLVFCEVCASVKPPRHLSRGRISD